MKPAIVIRKAVPSDFDALCYLHTVLLTHLRSVHSSRYQESAAEKKRFAKKLVGLLQDPNARVLCAVSGKQVVGFANGRIGQSPLFVLHNRFGEIDEVVVDHSFRKQGITRKLIAGLISWFKSKNVKRMELTVDAYNTVAIKTWKTLGFKTHLLILSRKL